MTTSPTPSAQAALQALEELMEFPKTGSAALAKTLRQFIEGAAMDRVDAERYRWLRERNSYRSDLPMVHVSWSKHVMGRLVADEKPSYERLDAAIDAARSAEQKGKT